MPIKNSMDAKEFWRLFGLFSAVIVVLFFLNFGFIKLSKSFWEKGLKESVQTVLNEKYPDKWNVGDYKTIDNPFYASAASYMIVSRENGRKGYAVIIRTPTLYGPYPAVFIKQKDSDFEFVGYSGIKGRVKLLMEERKSDIFISYWISRLPKILNLGTEVE